MEKTLLCMIIALCVLASQANAASYTDNGNATVTDNVTGLMWQQSDDNTTRGWEGAIAYCEALILGGHSDWRLPNVKELKSIVDYGALNPAANTAYFPSTKTSYYWSSTSFNKYTSEAWNVNFIDGYVGNNTNGKTYPNYVRCVRGGQ